MYSLTCPQKCFLKANDRHSISWASSHMHACKHMHARTHTNKPKVVNKTQWDRPFWNPVEQSQHQSYLQDCWNHSNCANNPLAQTSNRPIARTGSATCANFWQHNAAKTLSVPMATHSYNSTQHHTTPKTTAEWLRQQSWTWMSSFHNRKKHKLKKIFFHLRKPNKLNGG